MNYHQISHQIKIQKYYFENCLFDDLNNRTPFNFETLGNSWYPNITFNSCLFSNTKLNIIETAKEYNPSFYSSIILKQYTFTHVFRDSSISYIYCSTNYSY